MILQLYLLKRGGEEIYVGPLGHNSCHLINYFEVGHKFPFLSKVNNRLLVSESNETDFKKIRPLAELQR